MFSDSSDDEPIDRTKLKRKQVKETQTNKKEEVEKKVRIDFF